MNTPETSSPAAEIFPELTPAQLYAPDIEELIDWAALAEHDPSDIRAMIPLITARLIDLLP
jgi:hypothetical protein